jgi:hypothetical protein
MMHQIQLNGKFYRSWTGAVPGVEKELKKALKGEEGFTYAQVADGDYPEGEEAEHFDLTTGKRVIALPVKDPSKEEVWEQELMALKTRCIELDRASDRAVRAMLCKTDTPSDRAYLQGIEADMQVKRSRIRELNTLLQGVLDGD